MGFCWLSFYIFNWMRKRVVWHSSTFKIQSFNLIFLKKEREHLPTVSVGICRSPSIILKCSHFVKSVCIRSFPGPYFPTLGLNTERYGVSLHINSERGKIRTRKTKNMDIAYALSSTVNVEYKEKFEINDIS